MPKRLTAWDLLKISIADAIILLMWAVLFGTAAMLIASVMWAAIGVLDKLVK